MQLSAIAFDGFEFCLLERADLLRSFRFCAHLLQYNRKEEEKKTLKNDRKFIFEAKRTFYFYMFVFRIITPNAFLCKSMKFYTVNV